MKESYQVIITIILCVLMFVIGLSLRPSDKDACVEGVSSAGSSLCTSYGFLYASTVGSYHVCYSESPVSVVVKFGG